MRIKTSLLVAAAVIAALPANSYARAFAPTKSIDNQFDILAGRAPFEIIAPEPKPEPEPEPEPEPGTAPEEPGAFETPGGAPAVSDRPAHLSIPESGLPKPTVSQVESVAPTKVLTESNAPTATQAHSVAPSATQPKPAAPTEPAQGSGDDSPSAPCKRGTLSARCDSDSSDDSSDDGEPVGAPARAQPPSGSWYDFINDPSKVQNSRAQFNQRINNPAADDVPTGTLGTYNMESNKFPNAVIVDSQAAGIGSILTDLGRRNEIDGEDANVVDIRSLTPPTNGHPSRGEVQETAFTGDSKMIVARFSDAANDGTPLNEGKMPWDQLVFLQFKQLSGVNIGKLRFIGQSQITNKATLNTMLDAFARNGRSTPDEMSDVLTLRSVQGGAHAGGPESQAFDAISWTDNVNGVYWLLSDFHKQLGNKRILQFFLRFNNPGGKDAGQLRTDFNEAVNLEESEDEDAPSADILIELV
jgi:hypothetical protein